MLPTTARLCPQPLTEDHWSDIRTLHTNGQAMATLGGVRTEERTQRWMSENLEHWRANGFGMCPWYLRESGAFVGLGGLRHLTVDGREDIEVGYGFLPAYWGLGLATELAQACINTGFRELGLDSIVALTMTSNAASRHVMEKAGMEFERELIHAELPHVLFRISHGGTP